MTVNTHGITHDRVVYGEWSPGATRYKADDTSRRVHRELVDAWILSGAALLNGILVSKGIEPDELALYPDAYAIVQAGIVDYAMMRIMRKLGDTAKAEAYLESFREYRNVLRDRPEELGDADDAEALTPSSVDLTQAPVAHTWGSEQW